MTPEEIDQLAQMCNDACLTETGKKLYAAIITDAVFNRIIGNDHPDPGGLADELGNDKIIDLARQELEALTDTEKDQLATVAGDHLRHLVVGVSKNAFKAMRNGIIDSDKLTPEFLAVASAAQCVATATK